MANRKYLVQAVVTVVLCAGTIVIGVIQISQGDTLFGIVIGVLGAIVLLLAIRNLRKFGSSQPPKDKPQG